MRKRRLKKLWKQLAAIRSSKKQGRDQLLIRLGSAKKEAGRAWWLVQIDLPKPGEPVDDKTFCYRLKRDKLREVRRREGRYLLRAFVPQAMAATEVWTQYIGLTDIEESFRNLKGDLAVRPIYHQKDERIEAHIFLSFLAYYLHVALRGKLRQLAGGLTPRAVLEKFATVQMLDVYLPVGTGDEVVMPRYTEPDKDLKLLLASMGLELPQQPPPKIQPRDMRLS
jgi:hypothetical protein